VPAPGRSAPAACHSEPDGVMLRQSVMSRPWFRPALPLLLCALLVCVLLAGCATQTAVPTAAQTPTPSVSHASTVRPSTPQAAARADAASLLASFVPPPGTTRLPQEPDPLPNPLMNPGVGMPASPDLVLLTAWWSGPGTPQQTLAWIDAHRPGGTVMGATSLGNATAPTGALSYDRPSTTQLSRRSLEITFDRIGARTVLRTDAVVMWLPSRPAGATIPTTVTRIALVATPGGQFGRTRRTVVPLPAVTDKLIVAKIVTLLNGLPMTGDAATSCGNEIGAMLRMSFYVGTATTPVAVADAEQGGCGGVDLTMHAGPQNVSLDGRTGTVPKVMSLTGATFPPPRG
jgi:hypothetical protein